MNLVKKLEEKKKIRELIREQIENFCKKNDYIDTLVRRNPAKIEKITSEGIVVTPFKGKSGNAPTTRTVKWSEIECVYDVLCKKKKIEGVEDVRHCSEFSTSYAIAFVGNFDNVENCSDERRIFLCLKDEF